MGRENKLINGGFRHLINKKENKIKDFITFQCNNTKDDELLEYIETYTQLTDKMKDDLLFLSNLEEIIIQKRTYDKLILDKNYSDISLSEINGYIYARHPFFKSVGDKKDIRVTIGKKDKFITIKNSNNLFESLLKDKKFILICVDKLASAMMVIIESTKVDILVNSSAFQNVLHNDRN